MKEERKVKSQGDLNFKKWLLSLSSIGNLILGGLLFIMGISAMKFKLDSIFIADRGLLVIGGIIILSSVLCILGVTLNSYLTLLIVFYNYILTMVFLSIFAMAAISMNPNLIDWIDNHWDIIRANVDNYDMNKFKTHVTTEINSLGIFSLTLNAAILVSLVCISNLLKFRNIIFALSPLTSLIFSTLSVGLILIGAYSYLNAVYYSIPIWSIIMLIILGCFLFLIGIFGYIAMKMIKKKLMLIHLIVMSLCVILLVVSCIGFFKLAENISVIFDDKWPEIYKNLIKIGVDVRKSFLVNQMEINLKFVGYYTIVFVIFSFISLITSYYQYCNIHRYYTIPEFSEQPEKF